MILRLSFAEHVEILVGAGKKLFVVHTAVIVPRSPFFEAALSKRWSGDGRPIELLDDEPDIFDFYLHTLYKDNVDITGEGRISGESDGEYLNELDDETDGSIEAEKTMRRMVKTYILADRLGDLKSCNIIVDHLITISDKLDNVPWPKTVSLAYDTSPQGSPIRRLMVDFYAYDATADVVSERSHSLPQIYLADVAIELAGFTRREAVQSSEKKTGCRERCQYHQHNASRPACSEDDADDGE